MSDSQVERIYQSVARERQRTDYPESFPVLAPVPSARYCDQRLFDLEMEHVWKKSWLHAGHISQLPKDGTYKLFEHLGLSIIISRGIDGEIRAFHNICRHRGSPLVTNAEGSARRFVCPYHSWGYNTQGKLDSVPEERNFPCLEKDKNGLLPVLCTVRRGVIYINLDDNAEPLEEYLAFEDREIGDFPLEEMEVKHVMHVEMDCNWKTALDNFLEIYHVSTVHSKSIAPYLDSKSNIIDLYEKGHARLATAKRGQTIFQSDKAASESLGEIFKDHNIAVLRFPNNFTAIDPMGFAWQTWWPVGLNKTVMEVSVMGWPGDSDEDKAFWAGMKQQILDIAAEDQYLFAPIQRSLNSGLLPTVTMGYQERVLYWYQEQIDRLIGVENVPEPLRMKQVLLDHVSD
ncbi:MAG: (2Fe-2S)-binding protein [Porticoccaceae bacterium]|nr:(2Fe-2S)-binding protein [Porticoccaceae bacterium]